MAELEPVYLLSGSDRPKVARALGRLRARVGDQATELMTAFESSGDDVVAACNALGLFTGERRLVVVNDVQEWKSGDAAAIVAYLVDPAPETVLALVGEALKTDSPLAKSVAKAGELLLYEIPKRGRKADVPGWVARQFTALGVQVEPDACRILVELVGENLDELAIEIDKLATWADGDPIGEHEIAQMVAPRADAPPFALTDAWGRRDIGAVLEAAEMLLERPGEPVRDSLPRIAALLISHISRVAECQAMADQGVTPREASERMKKNRFYVQKLFEQAGSFGSEELRDAVVRLAALDLALKGGSRLAGELELERALVEITRRPESAVPG